MGMGHGWDGVGAGVGVGVWIPKNVLKLMGGGIEKSMENRWGGGMNKTFWK